LVSLWFAQRRRFKQTKKIRAALISELRFLSSNLQKTLDESVEFSKNAAQILKPHKHIFLFGSGLAEISTKEGALKIKELTYLHCQAIALGANISNGTFSYLKAHPESPMIFVVLENPGHLEYVETDIMAMKTLKERLRGEINALVITDVKDKQALTFFEAFTGSAKQVHQIPRSGYMSALLSVIPLQRLAYDLTIALGFDPDRPRNLAKELTTK